MSEQAMPHLTILVCDETQKHVRGFDADAPLGVVFAVLLAAQGSKCPLDIQVKAVSDLGPELVAKLGPCDHWECVARRASPATGARGGAMDPTLKTRTECPEIVKPDMGELGAMLSILSDKIAGAK